MSSPQTKLISRKTENLEDQKDFFLQLSIIHEYVLFLREGEKTNCSGLRGGNMSPQPQTKLIKRKVENQERRTNSEVKRLPVLAHLNLTQFISSKNKRVLFCS